MLRVIPKEIEIDNNDFVVGFFARFNFENGIEDLLAISLKLKIIDTNIKILCEGAQGFWLDINYGNYPFVTSSSTLPYSACSLGFSPKLINNIYGACKIYDTRSGLDPQFPEKLLNDLDLTLVGNTGKEYGVTTGRRRKVNWLDINKLKDAINISGTTHLIISKIDIFVELNIFKLKNIDVISFETMESLKLYIEEYLCVYCKDLIQIIYSDDVENINDL